VVPPETNDRDRHPVGELDAQGGDDRSSTVASLANPRGGQTGQVLLGMNIECGRCHQLPGARPRRGCRYSEARRCLVGDSSVGADSLVAVRRRTFYRGDLRPALAGPSIPSRYGPTHYHRRHRRRHVVKGFVVKPGPVDSSRRSNVQRVAAVQTLPVPEQFSTWSRRPPPARLPALRGRSPGGEGPGTRHPSNWCRQRSRAPSHPDFG